MSGDPAQGVKPVQYISLNGGPPRSMEGEIVIEGLVCISVNGEELATFMCSPTDLEALALGFLLNEGLIEGPADVRSLHLSRSGTCVDVWLDAASYERPQRAIITAGCGGGVTFDDLSEQHEPLQSSLQATPAQLVELMQRMLLGASLYQRARGIHTAALADHQQLILQVEDVGRHNCLDRLRGRAFLDSVETQDRILLSSGRVSSEMINKARSMGAPIVCSRTSPTSLSVALAERWNMTLVAYLRRNRMRIYSNPERLIDHEG